MEAGIVEAIGARVATGQQLPADGALQQARRPRQIPPSSRPTAARGSSRRKADTTCSFSSGSTEQVQ